MYSATLTRIISNHNNLRDDVIEGFIFELPQKGQCLVLLAASRDLPSVIKVEGKEENVHRQIITSEIKDIEVVSESCILIQTRNSSYKLSDIKELPNEKVALTHN